MGNVTDTGFDDRERCRGAFLSGSPHGPQERLNTCSAYRG